jgi:hypothetical protein
MWRDGDAATVTYLPKLNELPPVSPGRALACLLALCAAWLAARPYEGIVLDAQLYALQTLATMDPEPLSHDLFLRFGSQNSFTLFPHLLAPLVSALGLEAAAATFTVISGALLLLGGGLLARCFGTSRTAWLSVALLIAIPGWYGAGEVLRYDEMYLNARVPAQVFSILALTLACLGRPALAALAALMAAATHPVMAAGVWGILLLMVLDERLPSRWHLKAATIVALAGTLLVVIAGYLVSSDAGADRTLWIETLRSRTTFLFLQDWRAEDWVQNALGIVTLAVATSVLKQAPAIRMAWFAAVVGVLGIAIAGLASMTAHFDILLLLQSWRWSWLSRFLAVVLLPVTAWSLWRAGAAGRASALLLVSGWALLNYLGGLLAAGAAVLWFSHSRLDAALLARLRALSWLIAGVAVTVLAVFGLQAVPLALDSKAAPEWVQQTVNFAGVPGPLILVMVAAWHGTLNVRWRTGPVAVAALAAIALTGLVPYNISPALEPRYSTENVARFADWRQLIEPSAEVLWHEEPVAVWVLLQRQSFLSGSQSAGLLYSRAATGEFWRRANAMADLASPGWWTLATIDAKDEPRDLTLPLLAGICQEPELDFVVDVHDLGVSIARAEWPTRGHSVFLYDCRTFRAGADT